jgi:hypothetical protein
MNKSVAAILCIVIALIPVGSLAGAQASDSAGWSGIVHEENSLVASVLYLPYMALLVPYRIVEGILYPTPTSQSTVPPPAQRAPH